VFYFQPMSYHEILLLQSLYVIFDVIHIVSTMRIDLKNGYLYDGSEILLNTGSRLVDATIQLTISIKRLLNIFKSKLYL